MLWQRLLLPITFLVAILFQTRSAFAEAVEGESKVSVPTDVRALKPEELSTARAQAVSPSPDLRLLRPKLPYKPGQSLPPNYVLQTEARLALIVPGVAVLGAAWLTSVVFAALTRQGTLAVPVVGPWMTAADMPRSQCSSGDTDDGWCGVGAGIGQTLTALLVIDGVLQTAGALLSLYGAATPRSVLVRKDLVSFHVLPTSVGNGGYGVSLVGRF
jgi:hypothetical protein